MKTSLYTTTTSDTSGALPPRIAISPFGTITRAESGCVTPTSEPTADVLGRVFSGLQVGLTDATKNDALADGTAQFGQLLILRAMGDAPLSEVAHPRNAATHLVPAATAFHRAILAFPRELAFSQVSADEIGHDLAHLHLVRRLQEALAPVNSTLDLLGRNLEDRLNSKVRDGYGRIESLAAANRLLGEALAPVLELLTVGALRAAKTRRINELRADAPAPTPSEPPAPTTAPAAPAPAATTTVTTTTPVATAPAPLPPAALRLPAAPAPSRTGRRGRRAPR